MVKDMAGTLSKSPSQMICCTKGSLAVNTVPLKSCLWREISSFMSIPGGSSSCSPSPFTVCLVNSEGLTGNYFVFLLFPSSCACAVRLPPPGEFNTYLLRLHSCLHHHINATLYHLQIRLFFFGVSASLGPSSSFLTEQTGRHGSNRH